jgi:hypothetical protein
VYCQKEYTEPGKPASDYSLLDKLLKNNQFQKYYVHLLMIYLDVNCPDNIMFQISINSGQEDVFRITPMW